MSFEYSCKYFRIVMTIASPKPDTVSLFFRRSQAWVSKQKLLEPLHFELQLMNFKLHDNTWCWERNDLFSSSIFPTYLFRTKPSSLQLLIYPFWIIIGSTFQKGQGYCIRHGICSCSCDHGILSKAPYWLTVTVASVAFASNIVTPKSHSKSSKSSKLSILGCDSQINNSCLQQGTLCLEVNW